MDRAVLAAVDGVRMRRAKLSREANHILHDAGTISRSGPHCSMVGLVVAEVAIGTPLGNLLEIPKGGETC
jgi:hypothetical protein